MKIKFKFGKILHIKTSYKSKKATSPKICIMYNRSIMKATLYINDAIIEKQYSIN